MSRSKQKWHCPHCSQTSSRHWNLKTHIERKHQGIGQPIEEDGMHSIATSNAVMQFTPHMMMSLHNNNNNYELNHQIHPNSFSRSLYLRKEEDISKKRDAVDEWLEFWRPMTQRMKKIQEIKNTINEFFSYPSSLQQPSMITGLGQTPVIEPIISPVIRAALLPTPLASAQSPQQQEQKNEKIIELGNDLITDLFITSTFIAPDFQRRARGVGNGGEDSIIIPREPSLPPYMSTSTFNNNNNSKKREEENLLTENKEEKHQPEEDSHDIEEGNALSRNKLLIDNEHDVGGIDHVYLDHDDGRKWVKNKDTFANVNDANKVITDPPMKAKDYLLSNKAERWKENWNKRKEISIRCIRDEGE
jgi:hypothetical protein